MADGVQRVTEAGTGRIVGHALVEQQSDGSHVARIILMPEATSPVSGGE